MSVAAVLPPSSPRKSARSLAWLACLASHARGCRDEAPRHSVGLAIAAYLFGAAALGALSIGHEYTVARSACSCASRRAANVCSSQSSACCWSCC